MQSCWHGCGLQAGLALVASPSARVGNVTEADGNAKAEGKAQGKAKGEAKANTEAKAKAEAQGGDSMHASPMSGEPRV